MTGSVDGKDRRRAFRYSVALDARVSFGEAGAAVVARITDISETGLFVAVPDPPPSGTQARLELLTTSGSVVGYVEGLVVRRVAATPGGATGGGVAVEVTRVDKEWIRRVVPEAASDGR
jgi:hypothetical protein